MDLFEIAIQTWGEESQIDVAIGELAELIDAIIKNRRGQADMKQVVHEIADVCICMEQLKKIYSTEYEFENVYSDALIKFQAKINNPEKYRFK